MTELEKKYRAVKTVKVVQVIETMALYGKGTLEDPLRDVMAYHSLDGKLLAVYDPFYWGHADFDHDDFVIER